VARVSGGESIRISMGGPIRKLPKGESTIVTNGRGGLAVHIDPDLDPRERAAVTAHELRHIDWVTNDATNLDILKGQAAGISINIRSTDQYRFAFEIAGHEAAISVLEQQLQNAPVVDRQFYQDAIQNNQIWIQAYGNPVRWTEPIE
jgi:hypothetical protein